MVYENGDGADGGGRWMKIALSGSVVVVAFGLFTRGSPWLIGGLSEQ